MGIWDWFKYCVLTVVFRATYGLALMFSEVGAITNIARMRLGRRMDEQWDDGEEVLQLHPKSNQGMN